MFRLYQSYYKPEQRQYISSVCYPYDNTANLTPDVREYPQMKDVHNMCAGLPIDGYGLISWKFQEKTLVSPETFLNFVHPGFDAWTINPCYIIDALFLSPWEQGEIHHKGITQLAHDTLVRMRENGSLRDDDFIDVTASIPSTHTFYANYFMATPRVWTELFRFTDGFYKTISENPDLNARMMAASGYVTDPGMSHFIFLFERLVPSFFWKKRYKVSKYEYSHAEVAQKSSEREFGHTKILSVLKNMVVDAQDSNTISNSYEYCRRFFLEKYPNAFYKE